MDVFRTLPDRLARLPLESGIRSEQLAVDHKARAFGYLVVELHRSTVCFVCLPIHARRSGKLGLLIDSVDQSPAYALSARRLAREQILQIAIGPDCRGAAVEDVVRQAEQLAVALSDQSMHRLICIEEACPGHPRDFRGKRGWTRPPVECVVPLPQGKPLVVVLASYGADREVTRHS